jgi:hypothetical protein
MDLDDDPRDAARFKRLESISAVVPLVTEIG